MELISSDIIAAFKIEQLNNVDLDIGGGLDIE